MIISLLIGGPIDNCRHNIVGGNGQLLELKTKQKVVWSDRMSDHVTIIHDVLQLQWETLETIRINTGFLWRSSRIIWLITIFDRKMAILYVLKGEDVPSLRGSNCKNNRYFYHVHCYIVTPWLGMFLVSRCNGRKEQKDKIFPQNCLQAL